MLGIVAKTRAEQKSRPAGQVAHTAASGGLPGIRRASGGEIGEPVLHLLAARFVGGAENSGEGRDSEN